MRQTFKAFTERQRKGLYVGSRSVRAFANWLRKTKEVVLWGYSTNHLSSKDHVSFHSPVILDRQVKLSFIEEENMYGPALWRSFSLREMKGLSFLKPYVQ